MACVLAVEGEKDSRPPSEAFGHCKGLRGRNWSLRIAVEMRFLPHLVSHGFKLKFERARCLSASMYSGVSPPLEPWELLVFQPGDGVQSHYTAMVSPYIDPNQARDFALFFFFSFFRFSFSLSLSLFLCHCLFFSSCPTPDSADVLKQSRIRQMQYVVQLSFFVLDASMHSSILVGFCQLFG